MISTVLKSIIELVDFVSNLFNIYTCLATQYSVSSVNYCTKAYVSICVSIVFFHVQLYKLKSCKNIFALIYIVFEYPYSSPN